LAPLVALGRNDQAIEAHGKAIALSRDPELLGPLYNNRAWAKLMLGRADEALVDADKALELQPNMSNALGTRCWIHYDLRHVVEAERDCRASLAARPDSLYDQGMLALILKDSKGAIAAWTKKLEQEPGATELIPWLERAKHVQP